MCSLYDVSRWAPSYQGSLWPLNDLGRFRNFHAQKGDTSSPKVRGKGKAEGAASGQEPWWTLSISGWCRQVFQSRGSTARTQRVKRASLKDDGKGQSPVRSPALLMGQEPPASARMMFSSNLSLLWSYLGRKDETEEGRWEESMYPQTDQVHLWEIKLEI